GVRRAVHRADRAEARVSFLPYAVAAWVCAVGLYGIVTSRNLIHLAVCLTVTQSSTYVLLLPVGSVQGGGAPVSQGVRPGATTCALGVLLMLRSERGDVIHWFGGWQPRGGVAIGIDFVADPLAAAMAALVGGLVLVALVYSWTYLEEAARLFDTLMLVCCG